MIKQQTLLNHLNAVAIHFRVNIEETTVFVPDKFNTTNYPKRTQNALKRLQKLGYHLQTEIK